MDDTTLKPCPFCGGTDIQDMAQSLYCRECGAEGPVATDLFDRASLATAWNRRASDAPWQPIETAPHGEEIEVWNAVTGPYRSRYTAGTWPMGFWDKLGKWYPEPTHWRWLSKGPGDGA